MCLKHPALAYCFSFLYLPLWTEYSVYIPLLKIKLVTGGCFATNLAWTRIWISTPHLCIAICEDMRIYGKHRIRLGVKMFPIIPNHLDEQFLRLLSLLKWSGFMWELPLMRQTNQKSYMLRKNTLIKLWLKRHVMIIYTGGGAYVRNEDFRNNPHQPHIIRRKCGVRMLRYMRRGSCIWKA